MEDFKPIKIVDLEQKIKMNDYIDIANLHKTLKLTKNENIIRKNAVKITKHGPEIRFIHKPDTISDCLILTKSWSNFFWSKFCIKNPPSRNYEVVVWLMKKFLCSKAFETNFDSAGFSNYNQDCFALFLTILQLNVNRNSIV